MIEMMCRDGGTPVELLDQAASVVEESIGCPVDLLDRRPQSNGLLGAV